MSEKFYQGGTLPDDLFAVRNALFAEQRQLHWGSGEPEQEEMDYIWALIDRIRERVAAMGPGGYGPAD